MSTSTTGTWRERRTGQFASRQHMTTQRKALLAPVQHWQRQLTVSPSNPSSHVKVTRWVPVSSADDGAEEQLLLDTAARTGAPVAGASMESPGTPMGPSTTTPAPGSGPRTPHPLARTATAASSPRAAGDVMDVDGPANTTAHDRLVEIAQTDSEVAMAALEGLPKGDVA